MEDVRRSRKEEMVTLPIGSAEAPLTVHVQGTLPRFTSVLCVSSVR